MARSSKKSGSKSPEGASPKARTSQSPQNPPVGEETNQQEGNESTSEADPAAVEAPEAEDINSSDSDSAYAGSMYAFMLLPSSNGRLSESVTNYVYENGRRYHSYSAGSYKFPNDEKEQSRMDLSHHIELLILKGELFTAPLPPNPQKVLDIGCGTGIWAIDFADKYPSAEVIGIDLSPIQPTWVPPNCQFQVDDAEKDWTWPKGTFDYIHLRQICGSITDWPRLYQQAYDALKPGGWIEHQEPGTLWDCDDGTLPLDGPLRRWNKLMVDAADHSGRPMTINRSLAGWAKEVGFVHVRDKIEKMPIGTWAKKPELKTIGGYMLLDVIEGMEAWSLQLMTQVLGFTPEDARKLIDDAQDQVKNRRVHTYSEWHFMTAQKPPN